PRASVGGEAKGVGSPQLTWIKGFCTLACDPICARRGFSPGAARGPEGALVSILSDDGGLRARLGRAPVPRRDAWTSRSTLIAPRVSCKPRKGLRSAKVTSSLAPITC